MNVYPFVILFLIFTTPVFADESNNDEREKSNIFEVEMEDEDDNEGKLGVASTILYITIASVVGIGGYALWKIINVKRIHI